MKIQELDEIIFWGSQECAEKLVERVRGEKIKWKSAREARFNFVANGYEVAIHIAIAPKKKGSFIA